MDCSGRGLVQDGNTGHNHSLPSLEEAEPCYPAWRELNGVSPCSALPRKGAGRGGTHTSILQQRQPKPSASALTSRSRRAPTREKDEVLGWDEHLPPSPRVVGPPAAPGAKASRENQLGLEAIELPVQFTQINGEPQFTPESTPGSISARLGQAPHAQHSPEQTGAQGAASAAALLLPSPRQLRHHVF